MLSLVQELWLASKMRSATDDKGIFLVQEVWLADAMGSATVCADFFIQHGLHANSSDVVGILSSRRGGLQI